MLNEESNKHIMHKTYHAYVDLCKDEETFYPCFLHTTKYLPDVYSVKCQNHLYGIIY